MSVYNVALIGCGYMGQSHLMDIAAKENICIYAVCDKNRQRADSLAAQYHPCRVYYDAMELICDPNVDIVIIATYPSSHLELLKACLASGKHILCEKPITDNLADGEEFVKAVRQAPQCKVLVGYILRHNETYNKVKELIEEGLIGKPLILRMVQNHNTLHNWEKYRILIEETSPIVDCGVHYVDVMRWFTGEEVVSVDGVGAVTEPDISAGGYNYGIINVKLSGGSVGFYEAGWSNSIATDSFKEFVGPKGRIRITYQAERAEHPEAGNLVSIHKYDEGTTEHINIPFSVKPTGAQLDHLIAMIEKDVPANPTIEDVFRSFEVVCEADRKIREKL
jgi:predicted dehydrogenase